MFKRLIQPRLAAALADTPVVLLHGARQTGKSTLAAAIGGTRRRREYANLDIATVLSAAQTDAEGFLAGFPKAVTIDEVQRVPSLFLAIKAAVDRDRKPGRFLLTGSANVLLLPRVSESLAGRIEIIALWPLAQAEIEGGPGKLIDRLFSPKLAPSPGRSSGATQGPDLLERIVRGGYPEPLQRDSAARRSDWFASYLSTILLRDVRDLSGVEGVTELPRLLALLASRTAGLLNFADLSRGLAMPQTTLKRYFALLEATFLILNVPAWSSNRGLRLTKSPKIFLADTGLACHLIDADRRRLAGAGAPRGGLVENFVALELAKLSTWSRTRPALFHYRTANGSEVDLVLEDRAGQLVGVEVKAGSSVSGSDFAGLHNLAEAAGDKFVRGVVMYGGDQLVSFGPSMHAVPIHWLWTH